MVLVNQFKYTPLKYSVTSAIKLVSWQVRCTNAYELLIIKTNIHLDKSVILLSQIKAKAHWWVMI